MLQKQIGQTGIPVYNVSNACATGATALRTVVMAIRAGECDMGLAVGVEKLSGAGLLAGGSIKGDPEVLEPTGRYGAVLPVDGRLGTETMPGVFAQIGQEYGYAHGVDTSSSSSPASRRRTTPTPFSTRSPPTRSGSRSSRSWAT